MCKENVNSWFNCFEIIRRYFHLLTKSAPRGFPWLKWKKKDEPLLLREWNLWTTFCLRINYYRENVKFHIPLQRSCSAGFLSWLMTTLGLLWKELQATFVFNQLRSFELCNMRFKFTSNFSRCLISVSSVNLEIYFHRFFFAFSNSRFT